MDEIALVKDLMRARAGLAETRPVSARALLDARIEAQRLRSATSRAPRLHRRLLAGALVLLALLAIAVPLLLGGGGREGVQSAAAAVLQKVAFVAAEQSPEAPPAPGQYNFTRSKEAYMQTTSSISSGLQWSALRPARREIWIAPDGRGYLHRVYGRSILVSPVQRKLWKVAGRPPLTPVERVENSDTTGSKLLDTSGLPTDPPRLRELIEERRAPWFRDPPGEAQTFDLIGELLRERYLPPSFRAALYRVAAELPGVESLGEVRDPVGREGIAVGYRDPRRGFQQVLIFDSDTAALLGERQIAIKPLPELGVSAGTVIGYASYLESKVVDSISGH